MRTGWVVAIILVICLAAGGWYLHQNQPVGTQFRTEPLSRGNLNTTISATGTLEPVEVVDVGAQVQGQLDYFGKDQHQPNRLIDYGSEVDVGTLLAHIDDSLYVADVDSAKAAVAAAKANVQKAQADIGQLQAKLLQAGNDWKRAQQAGTTAGLSASDIDTYRSNYQVAVANLADGEAAVLQAQTGVQSADAALEKTEKSLSYCTITSPVKGTIVDRRMNIGQTVVAALNAPSLFLIAKDLKNMQVWASVNEADIGSIHPGQEISFSVDAFPTETFTGTVGKVRLNASMTQNVVTYTVEINTDNAKGKLLPYLTANVTFHLDERKDVLMVSNAALRWSPQDSEMSPATKQAMADEATLKPAGSSRDRGMVWVADGAFVKPIKVHVGITDGTNTEIRPVDNASGLTEGTPLVVAEIDPNDADSQAKNPFIPQFNRRKK